MHLYSYWSGKYHPVAVIFSSPQVKQTSQLWNSKRHQRQWTQLSPLNISWDKFWTTTKSHRRLKWRQSPASWRHRSLLPAFQTCIPASGKTAVNISCPWTTWWITSMRSTSNSEITTSLFVSGRAVLDMGKVSMRVTRCSYTWGLIRANGRTNASTRRAGRAFPD